MKTALFVDCCIRGEDSRTKRLAEAFLSALPEEYCLTRLNLMEEGLQPLVGDFFDHRQALLAEKKLEHPRFRYAHQFAQADLVIIAAPFWDLSFPALLKIYVENVSVDGITFGCSAQGLYGKCRGTDLVFLTTRGGIYTGSALEQGSRQWQALSVFFGFDRYHCVAAEGLDVQELDPWGALERAREQARALAAGL